MNRSFEGFLCVTDRIRDGVGEVVGAGPRAYMLSRSCVHAMGDERYNKAAGSISICLEEFVVSHVVTEEALPRRRDARPVHRLASLCRAWQS